MAEGNHITVDGNEAVADVAYRGSEVIVLYPIAPAAGMGELVDGWSAAGRRNFLDTVPRVVAMQGEGGVAGALHGALQAGALATTFTASQGLLLMIPDMYRIAGELTPAVIHVAARTIATHASSVYCDHSDVMAVRQTGWAILAAGSVQEAQDFALIAQAATLAARVPFVHFFDGFRTSHEVNTIAPLSDEALGEFLDCDRVQAHRDRALDPNRPVLRGSAQSADVFFQAREAANPFYDATPAIVQATFDRFADRSGRRYRVFDYVGHPEAERVLVLMGSGAGAAEEAVAALIRRGERVGLVRVRLFRPFDAAAFVAALPATTRRIAVLDRTKEPGSVGEPLYQDVLSAVYTVAGRQGQSPTGLPRIFGGRYGLASKEFTPAMAAGVFGELAGDSPRHSFTIGIVDDVTQRSLRWDREFSTEDPAAVRALFFGQGQDGNVAASRLSLEIIGRHTALYAQGYFVYDSRKAHPATVAHLRFAERPIQSTYLIDRASFVACQDASLLERMDLLEAAEPGAIFLLNTPVDPRRIWEHLPREVQEPILAKRLRLFVIDASRIARDVGLGENIGVVMQTVFFWLSNVLPHAQAVDQVKHTIQHAFSKRGRSVVDQHMAAADRALDQFHEVRLPDAATGPRQRRLLVSAHESDFARRVTALLLAGHGDRLPVSALPVDGTFPAGTARLEKRGFAAQIPLWNPALCTECGLCALVCPHAAIRAKAYPAESLVEPPATFASRASTTEGLEGLRLTIQVAPDDCTGCGVCGDICPARSKEIAKQKAIELVPSVEHVERERAHFDCFLRLPELERTRVRRETSLGSQLLRPLFEFSSACPGCGETPYLKLLSQLFGDRLLIGNATGCSSVFGGHLPTNPWTTDAAGRGPAWANSLFEDTAEFGWGLSLAVQQKRQLAARLLRELTPEVGSDLAHELQQSPQDTEADVAAQRRRVDELRERLSRLATPAARRLRALADAFVRSSVWIVGGDGWAYDIGFGGLDHVLAAGPDVNVLVLDTGLYSSTGGQASKSTPRAAVAKFAATGRNQKRKDLGRMAMTYEHIYVAQVALGADPEQAIRAFCEAESYRGPSLILAYSPCIAHGVNMTTALSHQRQLVQCGLWPLYRYDPRRATAGGKALQLDCEPPRVPFKAFAMTEARFALLARTNPDHARQLFDQAQRDLRDDWAELCRLAGVPGKTQ